MNQTKNSLIIDILRILPESVECLIQAPSIENAIISGMLRKTDVDYFQRLFLDEQSKALFIQQEKEDSFSIYIQKIEIKKDGILLFEGFDGCDYGVISKYVDIPEWFKEKYIPNTCMVSSLW